MNNLQKMGGVAALILAATFVVGIGLFFALLDPAGFGTGDVDPGQFVAFLVDNQALMYIWYLILYVVFGFFMVVLALALYERLKAGSPAMAQTATAFGLIWATLAIGSGMLINSDLGTVVDLYGKDPAQAASVWLVLDSVETGLFSSYEIPGGLWVLLVSWAALRAGGVPRALNYLGVVIGVAGLLTVVPALEMVAFVFGLGFIVWWAWLGIVMLRSSPSAAADKLDAFVPATE